MLAVIDWIVFPALTAPNTIFNILGLLVIIGTAIFVFHYVKDTWFTKSDEEKRMEEEWKADLEKKVEEVKSKSKVNIDVSNAKNWNEIEGIVNPIAEGRVKISVETPKSKTKKK